MALKILEHHAGDFWTLAAATWHEELSGASQEGTFGQFIKTRVVKALFTDDIPDPRDVIVICLVNTCDVFRFIFELDEQTEERIEFICQLDLIGRSIGAAVEHNIASPMLRRSTLTKKIPVGRAAPAGVQPALAQRQHSRALCGPDRGIRPGVPVASAVRQTHDLPRRAGDEQVGEPPRADAP